MTTTFVASEPSTVNVRRAPLVTAQSAPTTAYQIDIEVDLNFALSEGNVVAPFVVDGGGATVAASQSQGSPLANQSADIVATMNGVKQDWDAKTHSDIDSYPEGPPSLTEQVRLALVQLFEGTGDPGENNTGGGDTAIARLDSAKISAALTNDSKHTHSGLAAHELYTQIFTETQLIQLLDAAGDAGRFVSVNASGAEGSGVGYVHDHFNFKFHKGDRIQCVVTVIDADQGTNATNSDTWLVSMTQS